MAGTRITACEVAGKQRTRPKTCSAINCPNRGARLNGAKGFSFSQPCCPLKPSTARTGRAGPAWRGAGSNQIGAGLCDRSYAEIEFFSSVGFPKDPELRKKWMLAVNRIEPGPKKLWIPSSGAFLCSQHFSQECCWLENSGS